MFSNLVHFELHVKNYDISDAAFALRNIESKCIKTVCLVHHCETREHVYYRYLGLDEILSGPSYMSLTRVTVRLVSNRPQAQVWLAGVPRYLPRIAERKILLCEWKFGYLRYVLSSQPLFSLRSNDCICVVAEPRWRVPVRTCTMQSPRLQRFLKAQNEYSCYFPKYHA